MGISGARRTNAVVELVTRTSRAWHVLNNDQGIVHMQRLSLYLSLTEYNLILLSSVARDVKWYESQADSKHEVMYE